MGHLAQESERSIQEIDEILSSFVQEIHHMGTHLDSNMLAAKEQEEQIAACLQSFKQVSHLSSEVNELAQRLENRTIHMQSIRQEVEQRSKLYCFRNRGNFSHVRRSFCQCCKLTDVRPMNYQVSRG